jgi:VIT1/CCC1 family predicted Fe2+/Mn2+ transporter
MGANDGIVSNSSLLLGVVAASSSRNAILVAGFASVFAGALSMAAGEFVSVSSQRDAEQADLDLEAWELHNNKAAEMDELTKIYVERGLGQLLARQVAERLHKHDPLGAHARDELGLDKNTLSNPIQAGTYSAMAFLCGGAVPMSAVLLFPGSRGVWAIVISAMSALAITGVLSARIGGANKTRAAVRVLVGSGLAMLITAAIGKLVGLVI